MEIHVPALTKIKIEPTDEEEPPCSDLTFSQCHSDSQEYVNSYDNMFDITIQPKRDISEEDDHVSRYSHPEQIVFEIPPNTWNLNENVYSCDDKSQVLKQLKKDVSEEESLGANYSTKDKVDFEGNALLEPLAVKKDVPCEYNEESMLNLRVKPGDKKYQGKRKTGRTENQAGNTCVHYDSLVTAGKVTCKFCSKVFENSSELEIMQTNQANEKLPCILDGKFFVYSETESTKTKRVAICISCRPKTVKISGFINSTSNFVSHLKRRHGEGKYREYKNHLRNVNKCKRTLRSAKSRQLRKVKLKTRNINCKANDRLVAQKKFTENIIKFFVNSMIPLQAIDDPYFKKIFEGLNINANGLNLVNRISLGRLIDNYFVKEIVNIRNELRAVEEVCTTADIWSGKAGGFLGVTAHWLDSNLRRQSKTLACRRFSGTHNYDRIALLLDVIHDEFGLDPERVLTTVTDNGSNFLKTFRELDVDVKCCINRTNAVDHNLERGKLPNEDVYSKVNSKPHINTLNKADAISAVNVVPQSTELNIPAHLRCSAYKLNLCATTDANKVLHNSETILSNIHSEVIKKCNNLWNSSANCSESADIIHNIIGKSLSIPGIRRWDSLYDGLKQIASIQDMSEQLHVALGLSDALQSDDFKYINEYIYCSKPIAEALNMLQSEQGIYYGVLLPCLVSLHKKLQKLTRKSFVFCKDLAALYLESVELRFGEFFEISSEMSQNAAVAAISHPKFKEEWVAGVNVGHHCRIKSIFKQAVVEEIHRAPDAFQITPNKRHGDGYSECDYDTIEMDSAEVIFEVRRAKADLIISHYLADRDRDVSMLDRYPEIKNVFKKYNTPIPCSGHVDRLFPHATMANAPNPNVLSEELFEERLLLKSNLNPT